MSEIFNEEIEGNRVATGQFFTCLKQEFESAAHSEQLTVFPDISRCLMTLQRASAEELACIRNILRYMMREFDRQRNRHSSVVRKSSLVTSLRGGNRGFRRRKFMRTRLLLSNHKEAL